MQRVVGMEKYITTIYAPLILTHFFVIDNPNTLIMKHLAAYLLLKLGGTESPTADDIKTALEKVGVEVDDDRLSTLLTELEGKDLNEVIATGKASLAKFGGGGGGGGGGGAGAADAGGAAAEVKEEVKEEEEEMDLGGGMDMFGGDEGGGGGGDY
jgi:ribosomal protein L12E/L44/L45/RPP1/RPP2